MTSRGHSKRLHPTDYDPQEDEAEQLPHSKRRHDIYRNQDQLEDEPEPPIQKFQHVRSAVRSFNTWRQAVQLEKRKKPPPKNTKNNTRKKAAVKPASASDKIMNENVDGMKILKIAGRRLYRAGDMFTDIRAACEQGMVNAGFWSTEAITDFTESHGDQEEPDEDELEEEDIPDTDPKHLAFLYQQLLRVLPEGREILEELSDEVQDIHSLAKGIRHFALESCQQDTKKLRKNILEYCLEDPVNDNIPNPKPKAYTPRGFFNAFTACFLCPLSLLDRFETDPLFTKKVLSAEIEIDASEYPSFMYPFGSVHDEEDEENGLMRSKILIRLPISPENSGLKTVIWNAKNSLSEIEIVVGAGQNSGLSEGHSSHHVGLQLRG
ncbi:hypothetical protein C8J56DRAFT_1049605 [Mycena floridula]|nr:hypothetical protein C8J56DRAFT_1049605 [Mycena floridula]